MATTDFATIRDRQIARIGALTPTAQPTTIGFNRSPKRWPVREWALRNATSAVLRQFEIVRVGETNPPSICHGSQQQRDEQCEIVIAYPTELGLYGTEDHDDLEKTIRSDARQIADVVFSPNNYVSGQNAAIPTIREPEKSDAVWFGVVSVRLIYDEAMTLA